MIYILYSGDYEVYLGGNHLPESEILIESTRHTLDTFDSINVPVTLFADLLCLWRYRELGFDNFPAQVDEQLKEIVQRGHDVQMHLHPHWPKTDIEFRENGSSHYRVDSEWLYPGPHIPDIYQFMFGHLKHGKEYLDSLLGDISPDYRCIAYRAGAYGIMPGEKEIFAALCDAGYLIDSSVVPGYPGTEVRPDQIVNFNNAPDLGNYRLSRELGLEQPAETGVFEIPVAAVVLRELMPLLRLKLQSINKKLHKKAKPHEAFGYTLNEGLRRNKPVPKLPTENRLKGLIKRGFSGSHWRMMDLIEDTSLMLAITDKYISKYQNASEDLFFSVSFHPKDFFLEKREAVAKYHQALLQRYGENIQAITFCEAANLMPSPPERLSS